MYEVHNKIFVTSSEQGQRLEESFSHASGHMAHIPGFQGFNMLKVKDGSHYIIRVLWESEERYQEWLKSPHFREAHKGQGDSSLKSELQSYDVIL